MTQVQRQNEIVLNSLRYRIGGKVQSSLLEAQPERVTVHLDDWRGGLGVEIMDPKVGEERELAPNRYWWSTANTLFRGHLILPRIGDITENAPSLDPSVMASLAGEVYARWSTSIYKFSDSGDTWGSPVHTGLGSSVGDFVKVTINETTYMVIAYSTGYDYSSDGSSWSSSTRDVDFFTFFDDQLWGITAAGILWSAYAIGEENDRGCLAIEGVANEEVVTDIFTGPKPNNEEGIYVATNKGLWIFDIDNNRFVAITAVSVPAGLTNGTGSVYWRHSIYFPAGSEIYEWTPGASSTINEIGPGNDSHGLPDDQKGRIIQLAATHNELLALVDPTVLSANTGSSFSILAYNIRHRSWRCLYEHATANVQPKAMFATNSDGLYRLFFSYGTSGDINFIDLPYEVTNDMMVTDAEFALTAEHITSWITIAEDRTAAAVRAYVNTRDCSANATIKVDYEIDYAGSWTNFGTITSNGVTTYLFPNSSTPTGSAFSHIRFRITLARTDHSDYELLTPDMLSLDFEYRTKKKPRWAHALKLDMRDTSPDGRSPREQFADVRTAAESTTMVEFTFRDGDASYIYYVDVAAAQGTEETGHDFQAEMELLLTES